MSVKIFTLQKALPTFSLDRGLGSLVTDKIPLAIDKLVGYWYLGYIELSEPTLSILHHQLKGGPSSARVHANPSEDGPSILRDMASIAELFGDFEFVAKMFVIFIEYFHPEDYYISAWHLCPVIHQFFFRHEA